MFIANTTLNELRSRLAPIVERVIAPQAEQVDVECRWPSHSMAALADGSLMGLNVPEQHGGLGQGLAALAMATETIGRACPSSALCFGMHCVALWVKPCKLRQRSAVVCGIPC